MLTQLYKWGPAKCQFFLKKYKFASPLNFNEVLACFHQKYLITNNYNYTLRTDFDNFFNSESVDPYDHQDQFSIPLK